MPRGAKPSPESVKRGHRPLARVAPTDWHAVDDLPEPPERMASAAAEVWRLAVSEMARNNTLREVDTLSLTMLCDAWYTYAEATANIAKFGVLVKGDRGPMPNPLIKTSNDAAARITRALDALSLTPLSRLRLGVVALSGASILASIDDELGIRRDGDGHML